MFISEFWFTAWFTITTLLLFHWGRSVSVRCVKTLKEFKDYKNKKEDNERLTDTR